jgi:prepilin-type N-terminal cleavage/methylation domain-containing protein
MRNKGFTIIEMMVSLVVLLVVIALTVSVITYQSRLGVYKIQATSAQQTVETALVIIRNDLLQAGRWAMKSENTLFIKYNGFLNLEAPSVSVDECTKTQARSRSAPCLSCDNCGSAWTKVESSNSFTMDRFPKFYWVNEDGRKSIFLGALSLKDDCKTLEGGAESLTVTANTSSSNPPGMQTLTCSVSSVQGSPSFKAGLSYASPAIVYQCINNELLRNGKRILGGDISVKSLTFETKLGQNSSYWSVMLTYDWKSRLPTPESIAIPSTQEISVGIPNKYILRVGG